MRRSWMIAVVLAALAWGCGGSFDGGMESPATFDDLAKGRREYERGRYRDAVIYLEAFQERFPGSRYMDEALYLMAKAHQELGEYLLAADTFSRLLEDYPRSEYAEESAFQIGRSAFLSAKGPHYDQEATHEAIMHFRNYLVRYPEGAYRDKVETYLRESQERLMRKACINGETYLKLGEPEPARFYFNKALEIRRDVPAAADCLLGLARSHEDEDDPAGAREAYERLRQWLAESGEGVLEPGRREELAETIAERLDDLASEVSKSAGAVDEE
ncbi:MAG: outer membrane protein assembly factor BamD [Candidatus Eisenbacteria bacterium]|nr:outer membrane protein assembly factor BamD [Candidatus Eisenbacteria bacterium]